MGADPSPITRLADCLCARLCHEMSGPLGTTAGVLELALEDPQHAAESIQLAWEAAAEMVARLRLLRAAWAGDCGPMDAAMLAALAGAGRPRIRLELGGLAGMFPAPMARVLLNMLLLATEALPQGGTIRLDGAAGQDVALMVTGTRAAWPPGLAAALLDPLAAPLEDPRTVLAPLVALLALQAGLRLRLLFPGGGGGGAAAPLLLTIA